MNVTDVSYVLIHLANGKDLVVCGEFESVRDRLMSEGGARGKWLDFADPSGARVAFHSANVDYIEERGRNWELPL